MESSCHQLPFDLILALYDRLEFTLCRLQRQYAPFSHHLPVIQILHLIKRVRFFLNRALGKIYVDLDARMSYCPPIALTWLSKMDRQYRRCLSLVNFLSLRDLIGPRRSHVVPLCQIAG